MRLGLGRVSLHVDERNADPDEPYHLGIEFGAWNENPGWVRWYDFRINLIWFSLTIVLRGASSWES
jgi:hypothetical protein